jgi:putative ATP-dependent endonuclease of OLD family
MYISKVKIQNFKCFNETFVLELEKGLNIIVGDNEAGKSTILEAIHLALTGLYNGKYLKNELSEYLFNKKAVLDYKASLKTENVLPPPEIIIEVFIGGDDCPIFEGDGNSEGKGDCSVCMKVSLDEKYKGEYAEYVKEDGVTGIPIEYYDITWATSAREIITPRKMPIKSALIDSSSNRYSNGSDIYITHIIKNHLDEKQRHGLSQAHRKLHSAFMDDESVKKVNEVIKGISKKKEKDKEVKLSIDLSPKNAWENNMLTYVEDVPFQFIGKGDQAMVKTKLALEHKKAKEANIILLEEPENHLSHARLNQLIKDIHDKCQEKQILISTHSSFVANKLGLDKLIFLHDRTYTRLNALKGSTQEFFEKIPGYDTLRLILCKRAILVEGDSDELIVQKAYMMKNENHLPIEDGIDVISVGTSFLRFLEIGEKIKKEICVVTDNDGDVDALRSKYAEYLGDNAKAGIKICFDETIDAGGLMDGNKPYNYNTLEPNLLKVNSLALLNKVLGVNKETDEDLQLYMLKNKTECALRIFKTNEAITIPQYILDAIG